MKEGRKCENFFIERGNFCMKIKNNILYNGEGGKYGTKKND